MSSSEGVNFKVYCSNGENNEVKRFFVDVCTVTSFVFMKEKLKSVFPNLREGEFKITWKDADGDFISITNDDDFFTALTEMSDTNSNNPIVLYVSMDTKSTEDSQRQFRVVCDICQKGITGYRYKCIECPDFDLCANCESSGHHSEHIMLRFPNSNTPIAKLDRKMMHHAVKALKKSAFHVARDAHRCARDSFKMSDRAKKNATEEPNTSTANECPFNPNDLGEMFTQNITPLVEMFAKGASTLSEQAGPNHISDLVRSVAEAFTGAAASANASATETPTASTPQPPASQNGETAQPSAPSGNNTGHTSEATSQDMDWTIVVDSEETPSEKSATSEPNKTQSSQIPKTQPPPPPQDPRLMRGLAQLYEMGFSNENLFLNYMLETHNYNVSDVVKAILELK